MTMRIIVCKLLYSLYNVYFHMVAVETQDNHLLFRFQKCANSLNVLFIILRIMWYHRYNLCGLSVFVCEVLGNSIASTSRS